MTNNRFFPGLLFCAVLAGPGSAARAAILDFEGFAAGRIIDDEYAGISISATNAVSGPNSAVIFDTANPTGGDADLAGPFSSPQNPGLVDDLAPGNVLIIHENNTCSGGFCTNPDDDGSGGIIDIDFGTPVPLLQSMDFFDIEFDEDNGNGKVSLFDTSDALLAIFDIPFTGGDNTWDRLVMDTQNVRRIEVSLAGSGAIDNIRFAAVPVPAAAWLFVSGLLGLIGAALRNRAA